MATKAPATIGSTAGAVVGAILGGRKGAKAGSRLGHSVETAGRTVASSPAGLAVRSGKAHKPVQAVNAAQFAVKRAAKISKALAKVQAAQASIDAGPTFDPDEAAALIKRVGGSNREARDLSTKIVGESGGDPKAVGNDPGGTTGLGLWQMTTGVGNDDLIARHGGPDAMLKPKPNARAALELYRGGGLSNWYAPSNAPGDPSKAAPKKAPKAAMRTLRKAGVPLPRPTKGAKAPSQTPKQAAKKFKGHYVDPHHSEPTEIDQGVDYGGTGPLGAIGNAKIVDPGHGSFGGGPFIAYELTDGPRKGWTVYVAEGVSPRSGLHEGQRVKKGEPIAEQHGGIETGWAAKPGVPYSTASTLTSKLHPEQVAGRHENFTGNPSKSDPVEGRDFLNFISGKPGMNLKSSGFSFASGGSSGSSGSASTSSGASPKSGSTKAAATKTKGLTARQKLAKINSIFDNPPTTTSSSKSSGGLALGSKTLAALSRSHGSPVV